MPRKPKPAAPVLNKVEQDFNAAIDRLLDGRPTNRDLVKKAKAGALRVNKATVAAEAGRSRVTLDKYAAVIARIVALEAKPVTTAGDVITRLREKNAELAKQRQAALDGMAAMVISMRAMEKSTDQEVRKALRRAARPNQNRIVGLTGQIVQFPDESDDAS